MQAAVFFLKNLFHIFDGGDVFDCPVKISISADFFDGVGAFKNIGFFQINGADRDFKPFFAAENLFVVAVLPQGKIYFFSRQVVESSLQAAESVFVLTVVRKMSREKITDIPAFEKVARKVVFQYRFK